MLQAAWDKCETRVLVNNSFFSPSKHLGNNHGSNIFIGDLEQGLKPNFVWGYNFLQSSIYIS